MPSTSTHRSRRPRSRSRSRSRSPTRRDAPPHHRRSRSPLRDRPRRRPFNATLISRHDLTRLEPLFEYYLDVQKGILIADLSEAEVRGRWKSFVGKWNDGDLAEGWYDPATLTTVLSRSRTSSTNEPTQPTRGNRPLNPTEPPPITHDASDSDSDSSSSSIGPAPPPTALSTSTIHPTHGPTPPTSTDLSSQRAATHASRQASHLSARSTLQHNRKAERAVQKERLEELVPRADVGTFERRVEKRLERAEGKKWWWWWGGGGDEDAGAGGEWEEGDGLGELKREKERRETKRSEWERRREEDARVKRGEWEKRMEGVREREEKVLDGFREIVRARFGEGGEGR